VGKLQSQKLEVAAGVNITLVKGILLLLWLDNTWLWWSLFSTLGPWFDKYLGTLSFPKVWKKLELDKLTKQTSNLPFAGFCPGSILPRFLA